MYSEETVQGGGLGVSLESCQRLLLQVLAGLEVKKSLGRVSPTNKSQRGAEDEKKIITKLSGIYTARRLLQKPRHHRELNHKDGLLQDKSNIHVVGEVAKPVVVEAWGNFELGEVNNNNNGKKPFLRRGGSPVGMEKVKIIPSFGRRRGSTISSRARKSTTKDAQAKLKEVSPPIV